MRDQITSSSSLPIMYIQRPHQLNVLNYRKINKCTGVTATNFTKFLKDFHDVQDTHMEPLKITCGSETSPIRFIQIFLRFLLLENHSSVVRARLGCISQYLVEWSQYFNGKDVHYNSKIILRRRLEKTRLLRQEHQTKTNYSCLEIDFFSRKLRKTKCSWRSNEQLCVCTMKCYQRKTSAQSRFVSVNATFSQKDFLGVTEATFI